MASGWRWRPLVTIGAPPLTPQPAAVPADDGPDPADAARAMAAAVKADADPQRPTTPEPRLLGTEGRPCVRCGGLEHTIRQLKDERAELRGRLAKYELRAP